MKRGDGRQRDVDGVSGWRRRVEPTRPRLGVRCVSQRPTHVSQAVVAKGLHLVSVVSADDETLLVAKEACTYRTGIALLVGAAEGAILLPMPLEHLIDRNAAQARSMNSILHYLSRLSTGGTSCERSRSARVSVIIPRLTRPLWKATEARLSGCSAGMNWTIRSRQRSANPQYVLAGWIKNVEGPSRDPEQSLHIATLLSRASSPSLKAPGKSDQDTKGGVGDNNVCHST